MNKQAVNFNCILFSDAVLRLKPTVEHRHNLQSSTGPKHFNQGSLSIDKISLAKSF